MTAAAVASLIAAGGTGLANLGESEPEETSEMPMVGSVRPSEAPTVPPAPTLPPDVAKAAQKRAEADRRYRVRPGDSLSSIAADRMGDARKWPRLWGANAERVGKDPDLLRTGTVLELREGTPPPIPARSKPKHAKPDTVPRPAKSIAPQDDSATYANDLDGWIREAMSVMRKHGIPGSYEGIRRNIIRESGGNPRAVNNWDSNAAKGTPSKGLLQTIDPTFRAYHVPGTSWDVFDPVANIAAACNYAAARYGSIDNVNGAY
ncbi:transglycosylase SLT domain-containing protein [Streptomyces katsurahamanus]|uniref:Peptidoglycan-binding protein n=1 Tax=Streptomyces katsurahamanus TaxID=2577098 RepID=A0ABW9P343_9ACTN|nr:transglycosylase SLT domain-containing protein [Streptomyces katsurahamanus]MQS40017.1 peptidoglycan-binding protein [Streptomyces katsurahamanus]